MAIDSTDIVPLNQVRSRLTELAEEACAGAEKLITKNGKSYVALVGADRLDHYHRLEREHIHLLKLRDAEQGLQDLADGNVQGLDALRKRYGR